MKVSKWSLTHGQDNIGSWVSVTEEGTGIIITEVHYVKEKESREIGRELNVLVKAHNEVVDQLKNKQQSEDITNVRTCGANKSAAEYLYC